MPCPSLCLDFDVLGLPPNTSASPLGSGRNSRVWLLDAPGRDPLVAKEYCRNPRDTRDRQGTEARALLFLEAEGLRQVPRLLQLDESRRVSLLSHVQGREIGVPTQDHVRQAARFLVRLIRLSTTGAARSAGFAPASEAFLSADGVVRNIEVRLSRLDTVDKSIPLNGALREFARDRLRPAFARSIRFCAQRLQDMNATMHDEIPRSWRILSPSDFGLHNAVVNPDGDVSFLDFEYFGWDDPSKTLADFCLHPGMDLSDALQLRFLSETLPSLQALGYDPRRSEALFPLFGIKWCCILLNEFIPRDLERRVFAASKSTEPLETLLARQLGKAEELLNNLDHRAETFTRLLVKL